MKAAVDELLKIQEDIEAGPDDPHKNAHRYRDEIMPAMDRVRERSDLLERLVDDDLWPLPKYREMLFIH